MGRRGVVARGLGRSYGDAAQNAGGTVFDMTGLNHIYGLDHDGVLDCDAGATLDALMRFALPRGWFVPVTPGTRHVTVGGAIAADIHGKNHHRAGSFTRYVHSIDLLHADGEIRTLTPESDRELFAAAAGGMGLTGIILRARVQMVPVSSSWMLVDTERAKDLDSLMAGLEAADSRSPYSVAWIDCLSAGSAMGRGVISSGDHAELSQLPASRQTGGRGFAPRSVLSAPPWMPGGILRQQTVAAFNRFWFAKAPRLRREELQRIRTFFHPLDGVKGWNRIYGSRGFIQYQFSVPFGAEHAVQSAVETLSRGRTPSFLAVLKRFGPASTGPMSFPSPGWTLALDIPAALPGVGELARSLDDTVLSVGGRVYLAKDSRLDPR
ncbi:MAG TPA: FAD-binding oxidoreductase, partial [Tepidiformaceae bacterium]|nr:FAD-binding oxidoreductase [Tepidiformaceae bacterium]